MKARPGTRLSRLYPMPTANIRLTPEALAMTQPSFAHRRPAVALLLCVLLVFAIASLGAIAPPGEWYAGLRKPWFNPPAWVFGPAWTTLYLMIATATWLLWRAPASAARTRALRLNAVQLALNAAWTPLFFGLRQPGLAFIDICLLWIALVWMTLRFGRVRPLAGYLQIPMLLWVSFALVLNGTIWLLNT